MSRRAPGERPDLLAMLTAELASGQGERVSQLDHALQCAAYARRAGADDELLLAALLHDVGHFVGHGVETPGNHHGHWGAALVRPWAPERLAWLIEHHVAAKRYLCAVDPRYVGGLSPVSARSFRMQGGPLAGGARSALESHPWFGDALRIRRWDDLAKVPGAACAPVAEYRDLVERYFGAQP